MKKIAIVLGSRRFVHKSRVAKTKSHKFRSELIHSLAELEKRVLLADISINSPQDLAPYFNTANNTYYLYAGDDNVTIASGLTITPAQTVPQTFSLIISANAVTIGSNVNITTFSTTGSIPTSQTANIGIRANSISVGNATVLNAAGNISFSGGSVSIGSGVLLATNGLLTTTPAGPSGDIQINGSGISIGNDSIAESGGNFSLHGIGVTIGSNVTISTDGFQNGSVALTSGAIDIHGKNVSIGANTVVTANGATDSLDGNISIVAENEKFTLGFNIWMQVEDLITLMTNQSTSVQLGANSQIVGGDISIEASSGNPLQYEAATETIGQIASLIGGMKGHPDPFSLPITFQSWSPYSGVIFGNNTIVESSASIEVNAKSESTAKGHAAWTDQLNKSFGVGFGLFFNDARANVTVSNGTLLQAAENVNITTHVTNTIDLDVSSEKNEGESPVNPNTTNLSFGMGRLTTDSVVYIAAGSTIAAQDGAVNLTALGDDSNFVKVDGKSYRDGLATISTGTLITNANVQVIVNGTVSSGLAQPISSEPATVVFNQIQSVDLANNQLNFPAGAMKFQTGQQLLFDTSNGSTIPGLVPGQAYYAIVRPTAPNALQLAATLADAQNGLNIKFANVYPILTIGNLVLPINLIDNVYTGAILYNFNTLPDGSPVLPGGDGTEVSYTPVAGQFIGYNDASGNLIGALPAGNYTVKLYQWPADSVESQLYPLAIQLVNSQGQVVVLNSNSYVTTGSGSLYQVSSFNSQTSTVDFNFAEPLENPSGLTPLPVPSQQVNLANGQSLVYTSGLNAPVSNLTNGETYWAVVNPNLPGLIQLATSLAQAEAANPAVENAVPRLLTVANQACVAAVSNNFDKSSQSSSLTLSPDNSYALSNNASGGMFQLTINGPAGSFTTSSLAYNISASGLQSALNSLAGIQATVTGNPQAWNVSIIYNFEIGNFYNETELTFDSNPLLANGTAVIFQEVPGKPVPGLVSGQTYYAFNQSNPNFIPQFPQYILTLKLTNNASAADISVNLTQSMTDANGQNYLLVYNDVQAGLISLALPEVTAPVTANGSALVGGSVNVNQLATPELTLFSMATSGTFVLSLTNQAGTTLATAPIAFNATAAQLQQQLNALTGVSMTVVGLGTYTSPWAVKGIDPSWTVAVTNSDLLYNDFPTTLVLDVFGANTQQVWLNGATGGTFSVTLSFNGQQLVTNQLPYNISTQAFAQAINAMGFQAEIYGSGTAADPWQFLAYFNPISTGAAVIFNDTWNNNCLGMLNGQTYFAVTSSSQPSAGEVMLALASSQANATASPPVLLNMQGFLSFVANLSGSMSGQAALVEIPDTSSGVNIVSRLTTNDYLTNKGDIGLYPPVRALVNKYKGEDPYHVSKKGVTKESIEAQSKELYEYMSNGDRQFYDAELQRMKKALTKNKKWLNSFTDDPENILELSLGLAVMVVHNNSQVIIGSQAKILSGGGISLNSSLVEQFHAQADAGVSRTRTSVSEKGNLAAALALTVSVIDNTSHVIVQPNAILDAAGRIQLDSDISYPFAWNGTFTASLINHWSDAKSYEKAGGIITIIAGAVGQLLNGTDLGVSNALFNSSSNSATSQKNNDKTALLGTAVGGSVVVVDITNDNLAIVCDGAQINQGTTDQYSGSQGLSINATTEIDQISGAGQMDYFLNVAGAIAGHVIAPNESKNIIGGSVNVVSMDNATRALIGGNAPEVGNFTSTDANGPTKINYGDEGLALSATTIVNYITLSQSGSKASGIGIEASVAVASVQAQNTTAAILSAANAPVINNTANSSGNISITSSDRTLLTPAAGGFLAGKAINLGFSSSVAELNRNVSAYIGSGNAATAPDQATWPVIQSAGNITIVSNAGGKIIPVSLAGSFITRKGNETGHEIPFYAGNHFGLGVSGDYSEACMTDNINAGINGGKLTGASNQQVLSIRALNSTLLDLATGSASIISKKDKGNAVGFGGSASFVSYTSSVMGTIANAVIASFSIEALAQNSKQIGTCAAGLDGASVAGIGVQVAGSVAINQITNETIVEIENTKGSNLGSIDLQSLDADNVWAAAGTLTLLTSIGSDAEFDEGRLKTKVGLGLGFAQNLLSSTTHTIISNSELGGVSGSIDLNAEQSSRSFVLAAGTVFEAGSGIGISAYGMVAYNQYTNADVQACLENSQISSSATGVPAGMVIAAHLIPIMITAAGDLGLGISWKAGEGAEVAIGAGVAVTTASINGNSVASVNNSNIVLNQGNLSVNSYTGQSSNSTALDNTLANLNLPSGNYNMYSLAIAGGLAVAVNPTGELAVGVNGVGAGIGSSTQINTLANITGQSVVTLNGFNQSGGLLNINALENIRVYNNAGGASIDIAVSKQTAVGVAVGIGAGVHSSVGIVAASIAGSNVTTAGAMSISANTTSSVTVIGFGVALDMALSESGGAGFSFSASSATGTITSEQTISSNILGGNINSNAGISLAASDNSSFYTGIGSGSLSVAFGTEGGAALSAGASVSQISPSHTISATIGSANPSSSILTTINAIGPVTIDAINNQSVMVQSIAVATSFAMGGEGSLSLAGAGASSCITTNNNITSGLLFGTTLSSAQMEGGLGVAVTALDQANLTSTVGAGAVDVAISEIPVGASLGISLSEISNNDNVQALVQGADITTQGGSVTVQAKACNTQSSKSVATSLAISLGVAGAGGNSNIYDNTSISAVVNSGSSVITGNSSRAGSLTVQANSDESVMAQIYGGSAGVGSIGVFMSEASRSGSTLANVSNIGNLSVGSLTIAAFANPRITSEGMSVTIGGLAGTGEVHQVNDDGLVQTIVNGSGNTWNVYGNLTIDALSNTRATAQTSGAGDSQTSVSVGELGGGYFEVSSSVTPTVNVMVSDVVLAVTGSSTLGAVAGSNNRASVQSGSGSMVGGNAAQAETDNSPTVSLSTSNMILNSGNTKIFTTSSLKYTTLADSIFATIVGGSAALADNESTPNLSLSLGCGTSINANGSVIISSLNELTGLGDGSNSKAGGIMAKVGSGGLVGGYGASSSSCLTGGSAINLADGVAVSALGGGAIQIGSLQSWSTNQLSYVSTGSAFGGSNIQSLLSSCLTNNITIGSNVNLTAPAGSIGIGTGIISLTTSDCYSFTFGLTGGSSSDSQNNQCATQSVTIGEDTLINAGRNISITPGVDPVSQRSTIQENYAIVTAHCSGLLTFPGTLANATTNSNLSMDVATGSQIISDQDVFVGPQPGMTSALWYTFSNIDGSKGQTNSNSSGGVVNSSFNLNGNVIAGNSHELNIVIPGTGNLATVNNQTINWSDSSGNLVPVTPADGVHFLPFEAGYQSNYNAMQLLNGLDSTSQAILRPSISNGNVTAITFANLVAAGGQVVLYADKLVGSGTVSAWSPNISITNNGPAYLLLNGIGIPNTLNMGKVTVLGNAEAPASMKINQQPGIGLITINQNGNGTTPGPAVATLGPIVNTGGSVTISNANGAFVQKAPINAKTVVISTPNSAYVVNTPEDAWGSGGNITDYWIGTPDYITPGLPGASSFYTGYSANLVTTTAAGAIYLGQSGASNSTSFSNWLYNTSQIPITNFMNENVTVNSSGDPSGIYPGKGQNWGTTEQGTGIIFFGSEIPYIWETSPVTFAPGSTNYLSQSCQTGYLDTYQNAQIYSNAASGILNSNPFNVAQGTGPQYAANIGRGIFPVVPSYFPTSLVNSSPQNANLGQGVTAQQLDITALYIDINAPINVGVLNNSFQANLSTSLGNYISDQLSLNQTASCISIPSQYLGGTNSSISGYYDTLANQIVLSPVAISGGTVAAIFTGQIISTATGKITVTDNPGQNLIDNQTGYPLVIQGIGTPEAIQAAIVQFNDKNSNLSTAYVYRANNIVESYQGPIGSNISQMIPVSNLTGTSAAYHPQANLAWQWSQQATISRNLSFSNNNNYYSLYGPSTNDSWTWGALSQGSASGNPTISSTNPFSACMTSMLVNLAQPINQLTEQVSASITAEQYATTYYINNSGYAWNYGPCTTWTWTYPTEIQVKTFTQLPACNPIAIDFSGVKAGSLTLNSNSSLQLAGNIQFPGIVSLNSGQNISQAIGAVVIGSQIFLTACGSLGNTTTPLNFGITSNNPINAQAENGLYLATNGNLLAGSIASSNGPVMINSAGSIMNAAGAPGISGTNISLFTANGSIGTQAVPLNIQTHSTMVESGSIVGGLLTASAPASIYLNQPLGDLRISSVSTSSPVGVVSITTKNGNIADGNIADVYNFNSGNLTIQQVNQVIDSIRLDNADSANITVAGFEGSVDQNYLQYWTMVANQSTIGNLTLNNGIYGLQFPLAIATQSNVSLTANGAQYYQQQANRYYANTANQTAPANFTQINNYANIIYNNAINVFRNNLVFGSGWSTLPQFHAYNSNFSFTASNETVAALTYGAFDPTNSFALLSIEALSPKGQNILGNSVTPSIQTSVLNLVASGSVGFSSSPVEIDMTAIQSGNLTPYQKSLLAMATNAGEVQYVGVNSSGQRVIFSTGSEPANTTITGVLVKIEQPLVVKITSLGLSMVQSGSTVSLAGADGDLNLLSVQSPGNSLIVSQQNINQIELQPSTAASGWSLNSNGLLGYNNGGDSGSWLGSSLSLSGPVNPGISSAGLRINAGGSIGSLTNNLNISLNGELNAYTNASLSLNSTSTNNLLLGEIYAGDQANIAANGNVIASEGVLKGSIGGFGENGAGWVLNSLANGSSTINNQVLTLTQSQPPLGGTSSASAFYGSPLTVDNSFISSFIYQSDTPGSTFYFLIQATPTPGEKSDQAGQGTVGLQINVPTSAPSLQTVGLMNNGVLQDVQVPGGINFASGDAIQVVLTYYSSDNAITVSLTDTITQQSYSFVSGGINLFKVLGSTQGQIGFYATGDGQQSSQSVSGFSFSYGSPTIQAQSLIISAGSRIGTANSPILTLIPGNITASAPSGVYLLETDGNMYVQSITSSGNVSLMAPVGSIVGSGSGSGPIQASSLIHTASIPRPDGVVADNLLIQSLFSIGTANEPLTIQVSGLAVSTVMNDIQLHSTAALVVDGGMTAGGLINIVGDSAISVTSSIKAAGAIAMETLPDYAGNSQIVVGPGGSVTSTFDRISMLGGDGVSLLPGSLVASLGKQDNSQVLLASLAGELLLSEKYDVNVNGSLMANKIRIDSRSGHRNHYLNLSGIVGLTQKPVIQVFGRYANNTLTIDDTDNVRGHKFILDNHQVTTPEHLVEYSLIDSVIMSLGSGPDIVDIGRHTDLEELSINTGAGDDTIKTVLSATETLSQSINGGSGNNHLEIDSDNQPVWMKQGQVSTLIGQVRFLNQKQIVVAGTHVSNALPVADRFVFESITDGKTLTSREYVMMVYQQVLNRNATAQELAIGTRQLDRKAINREQFARRLLSSTESLGTQVNAWYVTYLNRPASSQELSRNVAALRLGQSAQSLVSRILARNEFFNRTQNLIQAGSPTARYVTGIYRLAIDPSSNPDHRLMKFLQQTLQKKGRFSVANQVLRSNPMNENQTQAISVKVNQKPSMGTVTVGKIGPNGLTARLLSRK